MTLNCVLCGKVIDGGGEGHAFKCLRMMARSRTIRVVFIIIRIVFRILKIFGVCRK